MGERITSLAFRIADDAARTDIEVMCRPVGPEPKTIEEMRACWYDLSQPIDPEMTPYVALAVEYMDARGLLMRHPQHPNWTRPVDRFAA